MRSLAVGNREAEDVVNVDQVSVWIVRKASRCYRCAAFKDSSKAPFIGVVQYTVLDLTPPIQG